MSGVTLVEDLVGRFNKDLKMTSTKTYNYMIFCFTPDKKKIEITHQGTDDKDFVSQLRDIRDKKKSCYFAYHQPVKNSDGKVTQLKLAMYSDDDYATVGEKLICSASFDVLKKKLEGIQAERELHSIDDILEDCEICCD